MLQEQASLGKNCISVPAPLPMETHSRVPDGKSVPPRFPADNLRPSPKRGFRSKTHSTNARGCDRNGGPGRRCVEAYHRSLPRAETATFITSSPSHPPPRSETTDPETQAPGPGTRPEPRSASHGIRSLPVHRTIPSPFRETANSHRKKNEPPPGYGNHAPEPSLSARRPKG